MFCCDLTTISVYTNNDIVKENLNELNSNLINLYLNSNLINLNPIVSKNSNLFISYDGIDINPKYENKLYIQFLTENTKKNPGFDSYIYNDTSIDILHCLAIPGLIGLDLEDIRLAVKGKCLHCTKIHVNEKNINTICKRLIIEYKEIKPSLVIFKGGYGLTMSMIGRVLKSLNIYSCIATILDEKMMDKEMIVSLYV